MLMHREAKKSMSYREVGRTSKSHNGTKHKHPQVYKEQGMDLLRKLKFKRSNPLGQLQFERYGLLCVLGFIFFSSLAHKCLSSS
jgi:hypothetical protein